MVLECARCRKELDESLFRKGEKVFKQCLPCRLDGRQRFKRAYEGDKAKVEARIEKWREKNPEKHRAIKARIARRYRARNPELVALQNKDYRRRNKGKVTALSRAREAHVARATPKWADLAAIERIYTLAARLRAEGQPVHVDHRLPLKGEHVCGLHVLENLQIVGAEFNVRKKNRPLTKLRHETGQTVDSHTTMRGMEISEEMLEIAQLYVDRKITRARAAALLQISERQVTRIVTELNIDRVPSQRALEEEETAKRRLAKENAAQEVIDGRLTVQAAALRAGCHWRTIARHVEKLKADKAKKKKKKR